MSQLTPFLTKLIESGAERVYFAPNEQAYALDGEQRRPLPGGPVHGASILQAVSELLSHEDIAGLSSTRPRTVRHEHEGEPFVLEIVRQGAGVALGIRAASRPARSARETVRRDDDRVDRVDAQPARPVVDRGGRAPESSPSAQEIGRIARETAEQLVRSAAQEIARMAIEHATRSAVEHARSAAQELSRSAAEQVMRSTVEQARKVAEEVSRGAAEQARKVAEEVSRGAAEQARKVAEEVSRGAAEEATRRVAESIARDAVREVAREALRGGPRAASQAGAGGHHADAATVTRAGPAKIDGLLREMIQRKASDLHLTAGAQPVLRVDGEIHFAAERAALSSADIVAMVEEVMTPRAREDFEALHDADFAYEVPGLARFRVNVFEDRSGTGAVLRQIPIEILSAEQLGLPKACLDLCWLSKGLVLVTGPTGSGKSTTLAAMIDFINKNRSDHIITIEDPVEFVHKNKKCLVNQREVGQHTKSFKNALRAALREDPDIVLVGEMRDLETISIAIETAETGHLVFGTLHTTTAVSTVDRIIDQFPADRQDQIRVMLSESLKGVIAQILLPKIGGGRAAAHEILLGSSAVSAMVREGKTFQLTSVMQTSKGQGMVTMNDSLMSLVQRKVVDPKQAYIKAVDKSGFATMLRSAGITPPV